MITSPSAAFPPWGSDRRTTTARVLPRLGLAGLLGALLLWSLLRPIAPGPSDPVHLLPAGDAVVQVQLRGRLQADPWQPPGPAGAGGAAAAGPCRVLLATASGATELALETCPPLREGWIVRADGQLRRPQRAPHPLLAGAAERLARQGAWTQLRVEHLQVLARPATPIADLRRRITERFIALAGAERGGLLAALVLGSAVVPLPADLKEAFRAAGLSHALAASGFHLSVLLGAVLALGRPLGRMARLGLAAAAILLFLLLAGPQPSVLRAVLMGATALLLLESGRHGKPLGLLVLTVAVMLVLRPEWVRDVGFQLSVAATAGLVVSARPLEQHLASRLPPWLAPTWTAPALAVPVAATFWTLPLQLLHFGAVPLYAIPANLVTSPLLTPLTLGAMGLSLLALLAPPLLPLLAAPITLLAGLLVWVTQRFAALPMAQWQTGRPQPLLVALLTLALLAWLLPAVAARWRWIGTGLLALVVVAHLTLLGADQLLLVHQDAGAGGRDLVMARHRGRAALISRRADAISCRQARQLASGLGVARFDWLLLLDPVASSDPECWRRQAALVVAEGDDGAPLRAGQRLASPGLVAEALSMDSHAIALAVGDRPWLLLPDRQALWAWRASRRRLPQGVWLGFRVRAQEQKALLAQAPRQVWLSGSAPTHGPLPTGWLASGASGSLPG